MQIRQYDNQQFGWKKPTILNRGKMQSKIERMTGVDRNNLLVTNGMYADNAKTFTIRVKYLATLFDSAANKITNLFAKKS